MPEPFDRSKPSNPIEHGHLPLGRLALAGVVLVATAIVLVVALAGREHPTAEREPALEPVSESADLERPRPARASSSAAAPAVEEPPAAPPPRPRPRKRAVAEVDVPTTAPAPADAARVNPPPPAQAKPAVWTLTVESVATSVFSPWVGRVEHDALPVLPAPIDTRYLTVTARVGYEGPGPTLLHLVDRTDASGMLRLTVDDRSRSPLGALSDPADLLDPFPMAPIPFEATDKKWVPLVFLVPAEATTGRLSMGAGGGDNISWPAPQVGLDGLAGVWHAADTLRRPLRYQDSMLSALTGSDSRVIAVRAESDGDWRFEFPFTDLKAAPATVELGQGTVALLLTLGGRDRPVRARLADEGRVLILYAGDRPADWFVYRRRD